MDPAPDRRRVPVPGHAVPYRHPINHWPRGNKPADDAPFVKRLEDAHANCLENLPVFAVIVLVAAALGRLADIQALAPCEGWGYF
jgi:uncharacterized MAPEG superfamily protein